MEIEEFVFFRKELNKTQAQIAQLLSVSTKAVHSYEQGWRKIPVHVERQMLFLVIQYNTNASRRPCWTINKCPPKRKKQCPAYEFHAGRLCWFINGTVCSGVVYKNWQDKIRQCRSCKALISYLPNKSDNISE